MNVQPKFKFGDELCIPSREYHDPIVVKRIEWNEHYKQYEYNNTALESVLAIVEKPKKKKLYAYTFNNEVKFHKGDMPQYTTRDYWGDEFLKVTTYLRDPDFDIEYPEAK